MNYESLDEVMVWLEVATESSLSAAAFVSTARTAIGQFYPNEIENIF